MSSLFFRKLNKSGINYCHWKSNNKIDLNPNNVDDYDLLINFVDKQKFEIFIKKYNYKKKVVNKNLIHYVIFNEKYIIHLHIYFKLITAGLLYKNYLFPIKFLLNKNVKFYKRTIKIPSEYDDYIFLVIRKICEFQSLIELYISLRNDELIDEILFFKNKKLNMKTLKNKINEIDSVKYNDFVNFQKYLLNKNFIKIFLLSMRYYFKFNLYRKNNIFYSESFRILKILKILKNKILKRDNNLFFLKKGLVISVLGPDNSGKSTLIKNLKKLYSKYYCVKSYHMGSPKKNLFQRFLNLASNFISKKSKIRNSNIVVSNNDDLKFLSIFVISIKCVLQAYSKLLEYKLIMRDIKKKRIIFTDRYVKNAFSYFDGPKIGIFNYENNVINRLSKIELNIYKKINPSDLSVYLNTSKKILFNRNNKRSKDFKENSIYLNKSIVESKNYIEYKSKKFLKINITNKNINELEFKIHSFLISNNYI